MTERRVEYMPLATIEAAPRNPKRHATADIERSIDRFGFVELPTLDERTGRLVAGHGRLDDIAARKRQGQAPPDGVRVDPDTGEWLVPVNRGWSSRSDDDAEAYVITSNHLTAKGGWDNDGLLDMLTDLQAKDADLLAVTGFNPDDLAKLLADDMPPLDGDADGTAGTGSGAAGGDGTGAGIGEGGPSLADRFLAPPFDVLDTRQGWWQDRKRRWLALGMRSETGRGKNLILADVTSADPAFYDKKRKTEQELGRTLTTAEFKADYYEAPDTSIASGTSVFDPVLCELSYRWWSPADGVVLDPFAGGSVRGLMASMLGRHYIGNDLREEQVIENRKQAVEFRDAGLVTAMPQWSVGDSSDWIGTVPRESVDMIFTCPPYYDLESYSDDPADLSNMGYDDFDLIYAGIISGAAQALKADRFAVFVVGDARDNRGRLHDLRGATIRAAEAAGLMFCNGAILVNMVGSASMRAGRQFEATRTLCRVHQDVLVFCKGDRGRAAKACGTVEVHLPEQVGDTDDGQEGDWSPAATVADYTPNLTPVERHGGHLVKRDDAWTRGGASGAKSRAMFALAEATGAAGIISAGARRSPQIERAALVAAALGLPCRVHVPKGATTPEMRTCLDAGAEVVQHAAGRLSVLRARFRDDVEAHPGWLAVPFGMGMVEYADDVAVQVANLPDGVSRLVVPCGSGMTLSGILRGLDLYGRGDMRVLAVSIGHDPAEYLDEFAPAGWRDRVEVVESGVPFEDDAPDTMLGGLHLDPMYEAKCLPFLAEGDLLWCVGIRHSAPHTPATENAPTA